MGNSENDEVTQVIQEVNTSLSKLMKDYDLLLAQKNLVIEELRDEVAYLRELLKKKNLEQ